ncbi:MAG: dTDP-glucose 4,6-dehydratase [Thaumarchaeota archaeon]|nr:dTDP-glucose 4,6-dehydratase [Nitrososphaerota archaeon]MCL5318570.1 dTDP-glucose 4,6-dehydratase [Nitrososphaerota archaeon]
MRILVTGGCGFIGSNFIRYILSRHPDYSVINMDKLTYAGRLENLKDIMNDKRYKFLKGDICIPEDVNKAVKDIDMIVNFAAETHVDRSIVSPEAFLKVDVVGTFRLLEAARHRNATKFVQISTDEVYGDIAFGKSTEKDVLNPSNPYSASKASGELITRSFWKTYGLNVNIARSSNNFGPYQYPEKLIPKLILRGLLNEPLPLYGDGLQVRNWLYVYDNCSALDLVLQNNFPGEIFNVGGNEEITNLDVAQMILSFLGKKQGVKFVGDRPGHDRRYRLDNSKLCSLGWAPRYQFKEALIETIKWYLTNKWWWEILTNDEFFKRDDPFKTG